jgi:hypothetical protein
MYSADRCGLFLLFGCEKWNLLEPPQLIPRFEQLQLLTDEPALLDTELVFK